MSREDDGFLSRWSRRKRLSDVSDAALEAPGASPEAGTPGQAADLVPEPPETDAEILERFGLADPDSLPDDADFTPYMRVPLPEHLRRRAMRRLWRSNPVLANLDGLNDYDADFTGDTVGPGQLKTLYKVGRGFLADATDAAEADAAAGPADPGDAPPVTETSFAVQDGPAAGTGAVEEPEDGADNDPPEPEDEPRTARRRMAFRFPDGA